MNIIERYKAGDRNFRGSDFSGSKLSGCDLSWSNLSRADLRCTNLSSSDFRGCDLSSSDFRGCDLSGTDLRYSDLRGSDLRGAKRNGETISHFSRWDGLYLYEVELQECESGAVLVTMGCHTRTIEDWRGNFWNNRVEFPDNQSPKSKQRLAAFEFAVNYGINMGWIKEETSKTSA